MAMPVLAIVVMAVVQALLIAMPATDAVLLGVLWFVFAFCGAGGPAGYAAVGQRFGAELAGRVATAINVAMLVLVFFLQNLTGWILDLWPRTATGGWASQGYGWALALTLALQLASIAWMLRPERRG
jgi:hypothetical protein